MNELEHLVNNMENLLEKLSAETATFLQKGNKAAALRGRNYSNSLTKMLKNYRKISVKATK